MKRAGIASMEAIMPGAKACPPREYDREKDPEYEEVI